MAFINIGIYDSNVTWKIKKVTQWKKNDKQLFSEFEMISCMHGESLLISWYFNASEFPHFSKNGFPIWLVLKYIVEN